MERTIIKVIDNAMLGQHSLWRVWLVGTAGSMFLTVLDLVVRSQELTAFLLSLTTIYMALYLNVYVRTYVSGQRSEIENGYGMIGGVLATFLLLTTTLTAWFYGEALDNTTLKAVVYSGLAGAGAALMYQPKGAKA